MSQGASLYDVLSLLPDSATVVVTGRSSETLGRLNRHLLQAAVSDNDGAIVASTEDTTAQLLSWLDRGVPAEFAIIDATRKEKRCADPERNVWQSRSPVDFNGTALGLQRSYEALSDCDTVHLLFDTMTSPLLSADSKTVIRYAHYVMLAGGERSGLQFFPVLKNVTADRDVTHLKYLADALIEVRKRGGYRQIRLAGVPNCEREWMSLLDADRGADTAGLV